MLYCLSSLLRFKWTSVSWLRIALLRADSIQIGFCRKSLGFELLWFLHWKYISYSLIYFAARPDYSCRWVESNFVAGCKNSFEVGSKIVFFGLLWFLSLFRGIRIATDWNSISCYVTISNNTILLCELLIYKWKQIIFTCCHALFFDSNSHGTNFDISSCTQRFHFKEVVTL